MCRNPKSSGDFSFFLGSLTRSAVWRTEKKHTPTNPIARFAATGEKRELLKKKMT